MTVKDSFIQSIRTLKEVSDEYYLQSLMLLSHVLGVEKEKVYLKENEILSDYQISLINEYLGKIRKGYPLPYILKHKEFMSLDFYIEEGVLIPRPETETLAELAIKKGCNKKSFLDIGCGSGVIAISILYYCKNLKGHAIDISNKAISVTKENAIRHKVSDRLKIELADFRIFETDEKFDFIVSNPPYVRSENLKNLPYEPVEALDGGIDGFKLYPDLIKKSFELLSESGFVIFEIDSSIAKMVLTEMKKYFKKVSIVKDLAGFERFAYGEKI